MIQLTGSQQQARATGRKYRLLFALEGWGKTYTLAYDALWYARFANKQILVVTPDPSEFNQALSSFPLQEHNHSEILVSDKYMAGEWFMVIIDNHEHYTESELKQLIKQADSTRMLWIAGTVPDKGHWLDKLMRERRGRKPDWWVYVGEKNDSYTENQTITVADQEFTQGESCSISSSLLG